MSAVVVPAGQLAGGSAAGVGKDQWSHGGKSGVRALLRSLVSPSGQPNPPATAREIRGWYVYEAANAAFFVATQDFVSIQAVQLARNFAIHEWCTTSDFFDRSAWTVADMASCEESGWARDFESLGTCLELVTAAGADTNSSCVAGGGTWQPEWIQEAALVPLFGLSVGYSATYTTSVTISIVFQLAAFLGFGAIGDFGNKRKAIFLVCNVLSSLGLMAIIFGSEDSMYQYILACFIVVQVLLNFAAVLFNSWLPLLAASSPQMLAFRRDHPDASEADSFKEQSSVLATMAATGTAVNFAAAIAFLVIGVTLLFTAGPAYGEINVVRFITLLCGVWLLVLSSVAYSRLQTRPGPPLPAGESYLTVGTKRVMGTLKHYRELPNLFWFLGAYFVYSDGVSTMTGAAAVFASLELGMSFTEIMLAWFIVSATSVVSSVVVVKLLRRVTISNKAFLMASLAVMGLLPVYGTIGLTTKVEFYALVGIFGLCLGPEITFTRSIFASLVPSGEESAFMALYQLSDKGTAWAGPLVLTIVSSQTGSFRSAFISLVGFFVAGIIVLVRFDPESARAEKEAFEATAFSAKAKQKPAPK